MDAFGLLSVSDIKRKVWIEHHLDSDRTGNKRMYRWIMDNWISIYLFRYSSIIFLEGLQGSAAAACSITAGCVRPLQGDMAATAALHSSAVLQWAALDPAKHLHSRSRFKMETFTEVHHWLHHIINALRLLLKLQKFAKPWTNGFLGWWKSGYLECVSCKHTFILHCADIRAVHTILYIPSYHHQPQHNQFLQHGGN